MPEYCCIWSAWRAPVAPRPTWRMARLAPQPTRLWEERVKERPAFLNYPAGLSIWGGVPIIYENECVGAIGVSGVQSQDDEKIANAGVAALT
jgi:glc operon protein GlcG